MKIVLDIGDPEQFAVKQGALETFRVKRITFHRAIKTSRGHGKLSVSAYVYVFDRKKPWKFNPKATMEHRRAVRQAVRTANQGLPN